MKTIRIKTTFGSMMLFLIVSSTQAEELNTLFLQGVSEVPSVLKKNIIYPSGYYYVDVSLNEKKTVSGIPLTISPEDEASGQLCFNPEWLADSGIFFKPDAFHEALDSVRGCYILGKIDGTKVKFNAGNQSLNFIIPQAWLVNKSDAAHWDYGINGLRLSYNGNFNKNIQTVNRNWQDDSLNAYGNFKAIMNLGRWVVTSDMNASRNKWGSEFSTNSILLSTAIKQIRGDLQIGRSQTQTELFSDFGFYGAALRSNSNMRSWNARGYAPVITGVASSTSRITITQSGYTIYSRVVPPGPYHLEDVSPVSNGSLMVTVEDSNGHKILKEYPVATLPSLLRPGEFNYNFAVGERSDSNKVDDAFSSGLGVFTLASLDYGFAFNTLNTAALIHPQYQALGVGITQPLGEWGAFSTSLNASKASYDNIEDRRGVSASIKYAKSFTNRTDLQLLTYRYQSPGYTEFSNWRPDEGSYRNGYHFDSEGKEYRYSSLNGKEKARYEARLSHRFDNLYLSGSYWQQSYWEGNSDAVGATFSASTTVGNGISLYLSGNYSRGAWGGKDDYSGSLSVNIPFSMAGVRHYTSSSVGYNRNRDVNFTTNTTATVNERLNYGVSAGIDNRSNNSVGASASYAFDSVQTNMAIARNSDTTTLSGGLSGAAIVTAKTGLMLSKESSDTVAIVKLKDTPGVRFNGSLPTNNSGNTVLYLSGYSPVSIDIDPENIPENVELLNTSYDVVPTDKAIIYREFAHETVLRYILRLKDSSGNIITGGNAATEQGINAGFISSNGVLLMNLLAAPEKVTVKQVDGQICSFNGGIIKENTGKIQEVRCE
ncbi:PefC/AfrB family outer membrane usher protein [Salmonella enterica]|uniref:PefC/AfrB family outer membrane usher protein n=1 Tax=Salmonella diarizonae TaxID=59204 RepID=A0A8F0D576_SALDZ|nr:outer membrane usher protein PefC [Salmonella enterica]EAX3659415.1 outer membrane usher protein PefC [Salmonella enterica]EAY8342515.1 outer membrane usher protein PefC [Salmonella enterica]QWJ71886.1 PefC/AfrB family outer membrane usher protein [Salmonella enterica subsp. diarizonae]